MKQNKIIVALLKEFRRYDIVPYWLGTKAGIFFDLDNFKEFDDFSSACEWKKQSNLSIRKIEEES